MGVTKFLVVAALLSLSACKKGEGAACFEASECDESLACVGEALKRCEKCENTDLCKVDGQCTAKEGQCIAASDDDCRKGYVCGGRGGCVAKDGKCTVGSDADCKASEACKNEGYCVMKGNNCVKADKPEEKKPAEGAPATSGDPDVELPPEAEGD